MPPQDDAGDDEVVEQDPAGRYYRYRESVGKGRFKQVFKAFDTQIGIDVAWSKIHANAVQQGAGGQGLSPDQLAAVVRDIQKGLHLEHPNIIKCFKCWESEGEGHCINLITELFTSGNLRQYRNLHKHLDLKAVKRMARQILKGLEYLHGMQPPVVHGDLRCDKIYVNGHSGEIKIGDLGLATLLPFRWEEPQELLAQQQQLEEGGGGGGAASCIDEPWGGSPSSSTSHYDTASDVYAFGLCMLELLTLKQVDQQHCSDVHTTLAEVGDEECRAFVSRCLAPRPQRPSAEQLLELPFLSAKKWAPGGGQQQQQQGLANGGGGGGGAGEGLGGGSGAGAAEGAPGGRSGMGVGPGQHGQPPSLHHHHHHPGGERRRTDDAGGSTGEQDSGAPIAVGKLRGEDYNFEFHGKVHDGKMHFRLVMTEAGGTEPQPPPPAPGEPPPPPPFMRTIDFTFDPDIDTADNLAAEISENFNLSPTDTEICAAALREWLAKEMPGSESQK